MKAVVYLCAYEVAADAVNRAFGEPILPTVLAGLDRIKVRSVVLRPPPSWAGPAFFGATGLVLSAVHRARHSKS